MNVTIDQLKALQARVAERAARYQQSIADVMELLSAEPEPGAGAGEEKDGTEGTEGTEREGRGRANGKEAKGETAGRRARGETRKAKTKTGRPGMDLDRVREAARKLGSFRPLELDEALGLSKGAARYALKLLIGEGCVTASGSTSNRRYEWKGGGERGAGSGLAGHPKFAKSAAHRLAVECLGRGERSLAQVQAHLAGAEELAGQEVRAGGILSELVEAGVVRRTRPAPNAHYALEP